MMMPGAAVVDAFPAVIGTPALDSGSLPFAGNASVDLPASLVAGNLLLMLLSLHQTSGRDSSAPSGWTELFDVTGPGNLREFSAYYRMSDGMEGASVNVAINGSVTLWATNVYQMSGASGNIEAATDSAANSAPDSPNLAPTWGSKKTLWISACSARDNAGATITAAPANYTNLLASPDATEDLTASARRELEAASENPGAFSQTGVFNDWAAATIAIEPS
jgi:hypothetical protein